MIAPVLCALGGGAVFLVAVWYVLAYIRADEARRHGDRAVAERRARLKPGPSKREQERARIRAQARVLAADVAAGRIAPIAERRR